MMHHNISVDSSSGAALDRDVIDDYGHEGDNDMKNKTAMEWKAKIVRMGMEKMSALTEDDGIQRRGFKDLSKKEWVQTYP